MSLYNTRNSPVDSPNPAAQIYEAKINSSEFLDVVGTRPTWLVRHGPVLLILNLLFTIFAMLGVSTKSTVDLNFVITRNEPDYGVVSHRFGRLSSVYVNDSDKIEQGQLIFSFTTKENVSAMHAYEQILTKIANGSFTGTYRQLQALDTYNLGQFSDKIGLLGNLVRQATHHQTKRPITINYELNLNSTQSIQLNQTHSKLIEIAYLELQAIKEWKSKNMQIAPISGVISFNPNLKEERVVNDGEILGYIIQPNSDITATATLAIKNTYKLQPGNAVTINITECNNGKATFNANIQALNYQKATIDSYRIVVPIKTSSRKRYCNQSTSPSNQWVASGQVNFGESNLLHGFLKQFLRK